MKNSPIVVALAILYQNDKFLLQLRDDLPTILYPGHWGLFGGHLEPGETPEEALARELIEEISYHISAAKFFRCYNDSQASRYIYSAPLTVPVEKLILGEGQDLALLSLEDIQKGAFYSHKAASLRPLGPPHQKMILDFSTLVP
ncbi:MAG: NUDIX hydrolase [Gomphosphaeria aponina SAG 52.96 = DSM 107014]|uniref:NUDIX hydrolase n=1 Tax=Gomphosphaeria aponina SAG 52.96 = DSM 107014 TaxID=1521640 RepID=A0A941GSX4_9CHRO|nr:NUDIX hydrolase [Gomphosphaeria aponina SAG 52.96 = DSM 107014]